MLRQLVFLAVGMASSAMAQSPPHLATVSVRLNPAGAQAVVQLDQAVTRFTFEDADVEREPDIDILTPGLKWTHGGHAIEAAQPFTRFEIQIKPATRERDAKYPAYFRVGQGGVLYAPGLKAGEGWRTQLNVTTAKGETRLPAGPPNFESSIYIGPVTYLSRVADVDLVTSPDTPALLRERLTAILAATLRTYTTALRTRLDTRPIIVMTQNGGQGLGFRGDVTGGPVLQMRVYGSPAQQTDESATYALTSFIAHEVFHFWNGSLVHNQQGGNASWLHEGGADYAALLVSLEAGALDDSGMRAELASALTRCRQALQDNKDVGMNELTFLDARVRYPCGLTIQWAAAMAAARAGRGGFYDVWSRMITTAKARADHRYTLRDFYESAGSAEGTPPEVVRLLTVEQGPARWTKLESALNELGADIARAPTPETRRDGLVFHLLAQVCKSGSRGFYREPGRIRLESNETCTLLTNGSILTSVEGGEVFATNEATYAAVQSKCAARKEVQVVLDGERNVAVPCLADLGPARDAYVVNRWR